MPLTLARVLTAKKLKPLDHFLYLPMDEVWSLSTRCAIYPNSDAEFLPGADDFGLSYAIGMAAIDDIIANARMQLGKPIAEQLLEAFLYYFDHDAYITFGAK